MTRKRKSKGTENGASQQFFKDATIGCHVVDQTLPRKSRWWLGTEELPPGLDSSEVPEIAMDPGSGSLSAVNVQEKPLSFTISVAGESARGVVGASGATLTHSTFRDAAGTVQDCITFIAVVPPCTILDLCTLPESSLDDIKIDSDVQDVTKHSSPSMPPADSHKNLSFPLHGDRFLCTQGYGSAFTHHFAGNYHSVDFRCPVGTPIVAVADGVVVAAQDENTVSGVHVSTLFKWNSVTIALVDAKGDPAGVAEYVHLATNSIAVKVGDKVSRGDVIAKSGDVGFCPEPHLHFQLLNSESNDSESRPFTFASAGEADGYVPKCGKWYGVQGEVLDDVTA